MSANVWIIVKKVKNVNGVKLPVIILDGHGEVMEFDSEEEAIKMRDVFQNNSDSQHEYIIKKI